MVIQKLDMLKTIKEQSVEEQDFEKALACKKQIELVTRIGTNLKEVFNSRLQAIREGNKAKIEYYDIRYKEL